MFQPKTLNNSLELCLSRDVSVAPFNHCSSVCAVSNGAMIAWYAGSGECKNDQSVYFIFIDKYGSSDIIRLGDKTGNPILWKHGNKIIALWSHFENDDNIINLVDRWKYCSLWMQECSIGINNKGSKTIIFHDKPQLLAEKNKHLLARCNPLFLDNGDTLLPLYDELNRQGIIYGGNGMNLEKTGEIGNNDNVIQPTLWLERQEDLSTKVCALLRNMAAGENKAKYSESLDFGSTWTNTSPTNIFSRNNSMHVAHHMGDDVIIWNDSAHGRDNLTLGTLTTKRQPSTYMASAPVNTCERQQNSNASPIHILDHLHGSYPSISTSIDKIHFTYTTNKRTISYNVWDRQHFESAARRGNPVRRFKRRTTGGKEISNIL